uniref:Uncharacterized protein n=1 Tax=Rhizophora mucronata TaxID=61149 RepID=A0A2P2PH40_RHIMU
MLSSCSSHSPEFCSSQLCNSMSHTQGPLALAPGYKVDQP